MAAVWCLTAAAHLTGVCTGVVFAPCLWSGRPYTWSLLCPGLLLWEIVLSNERRSAGACRHAVVAHSYWWSVLFPALTAWINTSAVRWNDAFGCPGTNLSASLSYYWRNWEYGFYFNNKGFWVKPHLHWFTAYLRWLTCKILLNILTKLVLLHHFSNTWWTVLLLFKCIQWI